MAYAVIGIGFILLLFANTLAWLYLQQVRGFFVTDLAFRLENIAQISAKLIDPSDLGYIMPEDPADPNVLYYQQLLSEVRRKNNLQDIYILSPAKEILVEIPGEFAGSLTRHDLENDLLEQAMAGNSSTGALQSLGEHKFMSAVTPITDVNNMVVGVLVVEAPAVFFDVLEQFNSGLFIFSGLTIIVIVMVGYLLWYSFQRLVIIQEQMQDQEHLVKLGEMAASIAHEIRNPLSIIKGTNDLIAKKYGTPGDEFFRYIPAELNRLNKLIEDFLSFARVFTPQITDVSLPALIRKIMLGFEATPQIDYQIDIPKNLSNIKTDSGMLEQILLNIITNSQQAVQVNGQIKISVIPRDKYIHISVADNGAGIPADQISRIFDPFYTTKDTGSGLGLAISERLAGQLNGTLKVASETGTGTSVTLTLPFERGSQ